LATPMDMNISYMLNLKILILFYSYIVSRIICK
jgi:hypothetical protein